MNEIFHRTSIRKYQNKSVEDDKIEKILQAAMAAPSAGNQQSWEFYVIKDKTTLDKLSKTSPYASCCASAPLAFVTCYRINCTIPEYARLYLDGTIQMWVNR